MKSKGQVYRWLLISLQIVWLAACVGYPQRATPPRAVKGVLDLSAWNLKTDGPVNLDGEWDFLWETHLDPGTADQNGTGAVAAYATVPGAWNGLKVDGKGLGADGYATYRLKIRMNDRPQKLSLKILDMSSAFRLFVDGKEVLASGTTGTTRENTRPRFAPQTVDLDPVSREMEIVIWVSNFHYRMGGVWESLRLGRTPDIRTAREQQLTLNMFLFGSILIMSFYHFGLYALRRKEKSTAYFGLFCLMIVIRLLTTGERHIVAAIPQINWELMIKMVYLSFYLAVPLFALFIKTLYPRETSAKAINAIVAAAGLFSLMVLFTRARLYTYSMPVFQAVTVVIFIYGFFVLIRAALHKREGAALFLAGFVFLFFTAINDILYSRQIIQSVYAVPLGLFTFIFSQAFLLSLRFSKAFQTVQLQRRELTLTNKAILKEIAERRKAEMTLKESEQKYRALFEDSLEAMSLTRQARIVDANPAWLKLHGFEHKKEVLGSSILDFIHPEDHAILKQRRGMWPEKTERVFQVRDVRKDGSAINVEVYSSGIVIGGQTAILATIHDITEIKHAALEKEKLEARLQRAEKMEIVGTLAGGVAHDLNNILAGLVSYPDLLLMDLPVDSPMADPIRTIKKSGEKAAAIVQDLLTLARRGVVVDEILSINSIVGDYLASPEFDQLMSFHPAVEVKTVLDEGLLNIRGSSIHLSQMLMNLVSNAAEAMPNGGIIVIVTENRYVDRPYKGYDNIYEGDYAVMRVTDTGVGLSTEDRDRIFEPFYTKKTMGRSGTGLGMAVVWGSLKDHKGCIDIKCDKSQGTTFELFFPVTHAKPTAEKAVGSTEDYRGQGQSILVVDDVSEQRTLAIAILTKLGYQVTAVSSSEEAVAYVQTHPVDLLVLDMIMDPGIDGLTTYKEILKTAPNQKAVIASGYSENRHVREAQALGAGEYVKKPYTMEKIGLAVKRQFDTHQPP